jgi:hypothetical protein
MTIYEGVTFSWIVGKSSASSSSPVSTVEVSTHRYVMIIWINQELSTGQSKTSSSSSFSQFLVYVLLTALSNQYPQTHWRQIQWVQYLQSTLSRHGPTLRFTVGLRFHSFVRGSVCTSEIQRDHQAWVPDHGSSENRMYLQHRMHGLSPFTWRTGSGDKQHNCGTT